MSIEVAANPLPPPVAREPGTGHAREESPVNLLVASVAGPPGKVAEERTDKRLRVRVCYETLLDR
jgi:hypothetical protein